MGPAGSLWKPQPSVPLMSTYPETTAMVPQRTWPLLKSTRLETSVHTKTCAQMFIAALFTIAQTGSNQDVLP